MDANVHHSSYFLGKATVEVGRMRRDIESERERERERTSERE